MTARGPTLAADREQWTGSLHIVDLPSAEAARAFVEREPYNGAGLYERARHPPLREPARPDDVGVSEAGPPTPASS